MPASVCGVFGFKPSAGRCAPVGPDSGGLAALVIEHCISRTVRDSATLLRATQRTGTDAVHRPIDDVVGRPSPRLRIGVVRATLLGRPPSRVVADALGRTCDLLSGLGHDLIEVGTLPLDGQAASDGFFATAALSMASIAEMVEPMLGRPPGPDELEPFTLELIEHARTLPADTAERTATTFATLAADHDRAFERCDVLLSPTLAREPWPLGLLAPDLGREELIGRTEEIVGYTPIHNITGGPAMSVPLEWHDGLPIGMHLSAVAGDDERLLLLAQELEEAQPWRDRRPTPLATPTAAR